jgi:outer membrane protein OmpA-like peptidoglycan-associated protein
MFKRFLASVAVMAMMSVLSTQFAMANYPAAPVVETPTVTNQVIAKATEIQVNTNLDNVQSVTVTVNGKKVDAEISSDGTILVGVLIGPKDKVETIVTTTNGIEAKLEIIKPEDPISLANVNFAVNSSALSKQARSLLDSVAKIIKNKGFQEVSLIGFTDPDGSRAYNERLSLARAESVRKYLASKGIKVRFSVDAQADENPVADNDTKQGKALNRRVEIVVN